MGGKLTTFVISYDLQTPNYTEEDYEELYAELELIGAIRIQDSVWGLKTETSVKDLYNQLRKYMHSKDRLLVFGDEEKSFLSGNGINKISSL